MKPMLPPLAGLACLVATGSISARPASPPSQVQAAAAVSAETAAELSRTVAPAELLVTVGMEQAHKAIAMMPSVDPDAKQLESDYPGLWDAAWTAIEPELRKQTEAELPDYWASLEKLYRTRLTEAEARAIIDFYHSRTGQKLIHGLSANFDASGMFTDMIKSDSGHVSAQQLSAATNDAKVKTVEQLTGDDATQLMILAEHVKLDKFRSIGAETQKLTLTWINKDDPVGEAKIEKIMLAAVDRYMKDHPAKK